MKTEESNRRKITVAHYITKLESCTGLYILGNGNKKEIT